MLKKALVVLPFTKAYLISAFSIGKKILHAHDATVILLEQYLIAEV